MIMEPASGVFALDEATTIDRGNASSELSALSRWLREQMRQTQGLTLALSEAPNATMRDDTIGLRLATERKDLGREGYELTVTPTGARIEASAPAGAFWGAQTLLQMVALQPATKPVRLPCVHIVDRPRFAWRGLMLDCSRTFLSVGYLKKYVDACAFYKMNVLQLHLADDQGWRLEIRKHPRLTQAGGKFASCFPGEISGSYTQEQIRDLVRYAADRQVTIVPEIEVPGHSLAMLTAYPDLSCREGKDEYVIAPYMFQSDGSPDKQPQTPGGVLCVGNERAFEVVEDVIAEVVELFPSEYIHIAGDECTRQFWKQCPKCQARIKSQGLRDEDDLQTYFVKRVAQMIQARGRKAIGWDEILDSQLPPQVAVMGWRDMQFATKAAQEGHGVVMAQKSHLYLDYCYNRTPASLIYAFEPVPSDWPSDLESRVLGVQACMWTHLARTEQAIDMSIFPRVLALAEVGWTAADRRQWADFATRMTTHEPILRARGIRCFERNEGVALPNLSAGEDGRLWLVNAPGKIHVRKDAGWEPFAGRARQVTSGSDGTVWSVSAQAIKGGYALMRWSQEGWQAVGENMAAVQIAAGPDGTLWAVTDAYAIWRYANGRWSNVLGLAREVATGSDGVAWIVTPNPAPGGFEVCSAQPGGRWRRIQSDRGGLHVSAGGAGLLVIGQDDGVHCLVDGRWQERPGKVSQVVQAKNGETWAVAKGRNGSDPVLVRWAGEGWQDAGLLP